MANVGAIVKATGKGTGGLFGKLMRIRWAYIFISIIFIQAIAVGIHSGEGFPGILHSLGERFFNMSQNLQEDSRAIINSNAEFDGMVDFGISIWDLIAEIGLIFLWIRLLAFLVGHSPISNDSAKFINYCLAIIFFWVAQVLYLLVFSNPLEGQTKADLILTPFVSIWDFIKAMIILFSTFHFKKTVLNLNNNSFCDSSSGCVI